MGRIIELDPNKVQTAIDIVFVTEGNIFEISPETK